MIRLQFGCGENRLDGWQNFDSDLDLSQPLPFGDNYADMIFMEHVLEHFDSHTIYRILYDCHKILKPGGKLRVCVPILSYLIEYDNRNKCVDLILNHGHKFVFCADSLHDLLYAAGFEEGDIHFTDRLEIDGHWKVIGKELDDLETIRMEATK